MRWLQRRSKQRKLATPSRTDGELGCPSAMLQIVLSLLLTFTGAVVRPLAWMLCTPPLAWPCRTCPRAAVHATGALESLHLLLCLPVSAAQRPVSHRGLATAKDSQEATCKWNSVAQA